MIFFCWKTLFDRVVGQHDDLLRSDLLQTSALDLTSERVAIGPDLELRAGALVFWRPLFDRHDLFTFVAAPPLVQFLLEMVRVLKPQLAALSRSRLPDPPFVLELSVDDLRVGDCDVFDACLPLEVDLRIVLLDPLGVAGFGFFYDLSVHGFCFGLLVVGRVGDRAVLDEIAFFLAVLGCLSRSAPTKSDVGARKFLGDLLVRSCGVVLDVALEMWCSRISNFSPVYHVAHSIEQEVLVDEVDGGVVVVVDGEHPTT